MKQLVLDDVSVGQAVTILHGPYETPFIPPAMLDGQDPPRVDTAVPGRVFTVEAVDMRNGLIMLKALDGGGPSHMRSQPMGPFMALMQERERPDTYMFPFSEITLAAVSQEWLAAYVRNFCAHRRADGKGRKTGQGTLAAAASGKKDDGGSS